MKRWYTMLSVVLIMALLFSIIPGGVTVTGVAKTTVIVKGNKKIKAYKWMNVKLKEKDVSEPSNPTELKDQPDKNERNKRVERINIQIQN